MSADPVLVELAQASQRRHMSATAAFPATWNPSDGPNPIVMTAFPPIQKPETASDPLIEATHSDGTRFTVWLNRNLFAAIVKAGVREGEPCAIQRSTEKHTYFNDALGRDVEAWSWTVTTPRTMDAPVRGGRVMSIDEVARAYQLDAGDSEDKVLEGTVEPEPSGGATPQPDVDDGIPFHHIDQPEVF